MNHTSFTWNNKSFYLDGKPFRIYSGAIHYFRSLPEKWEELLQKLKDMGFNTVETYIAWNLHEKKQGEFDFSGRLDFERFLSIAEKLGLYAIVRPGPYICAEWDFGGFPAWLLENESIRFRTSDPVLTSAIEAYMDELIPRLKKHLVTNGGNVLLVAAENEYGSFGNDHDYMEWSARILEERGIDVPVFTSDGHRQMFLNGGHAGNRLCCLDFGLKGEITEDFYKPMENTLPDAPRMNMEHWIGSFDRWGIPRKPYDAEIVAREVESNLALGANFNMYMFHGGTNFGFYNGAISFHDDPNNPAKTTYYPETTNYDYDAPLTEWGECTPKYFAIQRVMEKHLGKKLSTPAPVPVQNLGEVTLSFAGGLFENLDAIGTHHKSNQLFSMEHFGQGYGYILYRTKIDGIIDPKFLIFGTVHDRMHVYFNGIHRATLFRGEEKNYIDCSEWLENGGTLDLLVENMGRLRSVPEILAGDRKGILDHVYVKASCYQFLSGWDVWTLSMEDLNGLKNASEKPTELPAFYRGTFQSPEKKDCFIHPDGFTKGFIVVNGFNLGRYWSKGPQYSLYLPASLLKDENEILVFDEYPTSAPRVGIHDYHELNRIPE